MKNKRFIIIGVVAVIIAVVTFLLIRRERNVNVYEYPSTLVVENYTEQKNADIYSKLILNKIYDYDTVNLNIYYAPKDMSTEEYEIAGFIQKNPFETHSYNIFIKKGVLPISIKSFLSHELIHLNQMEIGDLVPTQDQLIMVYKSDTISFIDTPYDKRPFEIEALTSQNKILKELNHLLYSK